MLGGAAPGWAAPGWAAPKAVPFVPFHASPAPAANATGRRLPPKPAPPSDQRRVEPAEAVSSARYQFVAGTQAPAER